MQTNIAAPERIFLPAFNKAASGGHASSGGTAAVSGAGSTPPGAGEAPDYADRNSWFQFPEITRDADTIYLCSTAYQGFAAGDPDYATIDNQEMVRTAVVEYATQASVFAKSTNVFVPYYRQASLRHVIGVCAQTGDIAAAISGIPYDDAAAALDYYFSNCNQGRPFILAGHSQGSALCKLLLTRYFPEHPDYYQRLVAAYVIGYAVTREDLARNPHLRFATGETDTGVIVSWNTEGPQNGEENALNGVVLPYAISINPLNWKRDETYAPAGENLGSIVPNESLSGYEFRDLGADARVNLRRGVVVTNARSAPMGMVEFFGPASFHDDDYDFFYQNIVANVARRIAAFRAQPK